MWRRLQYLGGALSVVVAVSTLVYFGIIYRPASCQDGRQNGKESGVDCGGVCNTMCREYIMPPAILWSRSFEVAPGVWNAVAYVENKNAESGAASIAYTFTLFEAGNIPIVERRGTTSLAPHDTAIIVEPSLLVGARVPNRTQITFEHNPAWQSFTAGSIPVVAVKEVLLTNQDSAPRISATIVNESAGDLKAVEATAVAFDAQGNALAASRTIIPNLPRGEKKSIVFTWPMPFSAEATRIEVHARSPLNTP